MKKSKKEILLPLFLFEFIEKLAETNNLTPESKDSLHAMAIEDYKNWYLLK